MLERSDTELALPRARSPSRLSRVFPPAKHASDRHWRALTAAPVLGRSCLHACEKAETL